VITSANPNLKAWRRAVAQAAALEMRGTEPAGRGVPIRLMVAFYFERPKSVKPLAEKTTAPDLDKLIRGAGDALTGICFSDDAAVTEIFATKSYGYPARAEITVTELLPASKPYVRQPVKDSELPF
jgi:crossover junction endodeoxyribonuclease RusA